MTFLDSVTIALPLALAAWLWWRKRAVFVYPSTWILLLSTMLFLIPAFIFQDEIGDLSPYAVAALHYCTVFVAVGLIYQLFRRPPRMAHVLASPRGVPAPPTIRRALRSVLLLLGLLTAWYLSAVPLQSTGLYGVLFDPSNSVQLREESLKLLSSAALHYAYLVGFSLLCPLAFVLLLARAGEVGRLRRWILMLVVSAFLAFYLLLSGARVGVVHLAVVGAIYAFLRNGMRVQAKFVILLILILFAVPMLISFLREQGRNEATLFDYFDAVGKRIFLMPLLIAGWFVEYGDTVGHPGLNAAIGLGESVDWSNFIALQFLGRFGEVTLESVTTPTAYFFNNYLYFGWIGLVPSWLALYIIDLPVTWAAQAAMRLRVPLLATMSYFSLVCVQTGFGVTMISDGYVLLALFAWLAARWRRGSTSARPVVPGHAPRTVLPDMEAASDIQAPAGGSSG